MLTKWSRHLQPFRAMNLMRLIQSTGLRDEDARLHTA
jgi:hypothetical protein